LLVVILLLAAYLRLTGINWDEYTHLHPDERFLTMVESSLKLPSSVGEYFNTAASPLNPHNAGHGFFVYGTLPIFLVRYLAEVSGRAGYDEVHLVGRAASAFFDLISIVLVYLLGERVYRRRVGLLAAALVAFSPLLIQHAHFFVVDSFLNTFVVAGLYFAILAQAKGRWLDYGLFGLALGMAIATKVSAAPLCLVLVLAGGARYFTVPRDRRDSELVRVVGGLALAAAVSLVVFRLLQPYAFSGPGVLGIRPNPLWLDNMAVIRQQASGDVDFPPALQWANRAPILFALRNLVLWGMGPAAAVLAWLGWGFAAYRSLRGEWRQHLILVVWTGAYFLWQSTSFTPSMRYMMPVYPTLALLGSWFLWQLWFRAGDVQGRWRRPARIAAASLLVVVVGMSAAQAFAFLSIYTQPMTRVAASRWIYANLPGPANLVLQPADEAGQEPIPLPLDFVLEQGGSFDSTFTSRVVGSVDAVTLTHVTDLLAGAGVKQLAVDVLASPESTEPLASGRADLVEQTGETRLVIPLDQPLPVEPGPPFVVRLRLDSPGAVMLRGTMDVVTESPEASHVETMGFPNRAYAVPEGIPQDFTFIARQDGTAEALRLPFARRLSDGAAGDTVSAVAEIYDESDPAAPVVARGQVTQSLLQGVEGELTIPFDAPLAIARDGRYRLRLVLADGALALRGAVIASESSWDDGLPVRVDGRDYGGLYGSVVEELYWQDDQDDDFDGVPDKLRRIVDSLDQADVLIITSNRQYGTIPRVPQRYPLTEAYYRSLIDCPPDRSVLACYARAQPGEVTGRLGYELIEVFESNLRLGPLEVSDQLAEEAFTVYDHPKVLVFAKQDGFDPERVRDLLASVDLSRVVHVIPKEAGDPPPDLMLPVARLAQQQAGGTWRELFPPDSPLNRFPALAVVVWWLLIGLVGMAAFPLVRVAFPGLRDGGFPLARAAGLVVLGWGAWILGSLGVAFSRPAILLVLVLLCGLSGALAWRDRDSLLGYWRARRKEIVWVEVLALSLFLLDLLIRIGNPDLWHPSKGGEKPMDLSYLTAVLKSTTFPPYDPWFAGGYINYYYYGFVLAAVPIKLLGIDPAIAYNLALPTFFALLGLIAYSGGSNLVARTLAGRRCTGIRCARLAGLAAALALVLLGNLGTGRMVYEGFKRIGASQVAEGGRDLPGILDAVRGVGGYLTLQAQMPFGLDSWYWDPSRAIKPGEGEAGPITEFPFFTFLYADLHAHMFSRVLTTLILVWLLAWLIEADERKKRRPLDVLLGLWIGALILGAIEPTNLADAPDYRALAVAGVLAAAWIRHRKFSAAMLVDAGLSALGLLLLSRVLYAPYHQWYGEGYGEITRWKGSTTGLADYFTVHGLFLFVIVFWFGWETRQWMAQTPLAMLNRLRPYVGLIVAAGVGLLVLTVALVALDDPVALAVVPLLTWAGLLFLRPGQPVEKRYALVLIGAALALTALVEVVVAVGDISRMNTVFKFYLQVWEMLSLTAAAALAWTWADVRHWSPSWRGVWSLGLIVLVGAAFAYPVTATSAKLRDRMSTSAPRGLDGMGFMPSATYHDLGRSFSLAEDHAAIRWMREHVQGSPVIVEANVPEYRWGSRFTIYTGLPGVLGWNWHQRQQRLVSGDAVVTDRALAINDFYLTRSIESAIDFLARYAVRYIIVGQLERAYFETVQPCTPVGESGEVVCDLSGWPMGMPQPDVAAADCSPIDPANPDSALVCPTRGLAKFPKMVERGILRPVFQQGETTIYEVVR
jgi:YYY domain-containing protein